MLNPYLYIRSWNLHEVIGPITFGGQHSIIDATVQRTDFASTLQNIDKWQEIASLQSIFVQIVWRPVARRHHYYSAFEEMGEQTFQNHCISNVDHLKIVESHFFSSVNYQRKIVENVT